MNFIRLLAIFTCIVLICNICYSQSDYVDKINNKRSTYFVRSYPSVVVPDDSVYIVAKVFQLSLNGCVLIKESKVTLDGKEFHSDENGKIIIRVSPGIRKIISIPVQSWLWPVATRKISFKKQTTWVFSFFHVSKDLGIH